MNLHVIIDVWVEEVDYSRSLNLVEWFNDIDYGREKISSFYGTAHLVII